MYRNHYASHRNRRIVGLKCFHVLFLRLRDWIPLGPLNDVRRFPLRTQAANLSRLRSSA